MLPDYGIFLFKTDSKSESFKFNNIRIDEILRIEPEQFSIFSKIIHENISYAVSFDFNVSILEKILKKLENRIPSEEYINLIFLLFEPTMKEREIKFPDNTLRYDLIAVLGNMYTNNNESYMPLIIKSVN